ncbi:putative Ig domain-containing protein [Sphingomonas nostoxanthinifaciens]|uniref:putative Ig domain-containing protein n=1 Tax=Sphingomonas nostoxanthinifaciens TaxID=2872652 RepID=UPI001CC21BAF|nr:putative Ig domain-containing protein [Sphingomonas nostoxanthinifaciens]UAK25873.1 putative Ig domain-containing protein [Sphingomonas nostoxanthinifaciens]
MARGSRYPRVFGSAAAKAQSRAAYSYVLKSGQTITVTGSSMSPVVGGNAAFTLSVAGGTAPYGLTLLSGTMPPGRNLSGLSEVGTYTTAGTYSYVLRVTDAAGKTGDLAVTAVVTAAGSAGGTLDFSDPANSGLITVL